MDDRYPAEALDWLLPDSTPRVVELGAGTGRLTRRLRARGLDVVAVDPSAAMLTELRRALPEVVTHVGGTEQIPLPAGSADVVVAGESWHWADPERALPEVVRVLRPGGRLALIWNARDDRVDWAARLGEIIGSPDARRHPRLGPPFGPADRATFGWTHPLRPDQLIELVTGRSNIVLLPADERAAVLAQVRQLLATHPALLGRGSHALPYVTECLSATALTRP
ncbi:class I SAM-dependent methyltransferase [Actinoplanes derwentensis]|uniref:Methyltransferase domain-containing protein n=1 Tax=Actinoplanes derwentensis TaxID=113562 RepID=A0A1H1RD40_9ACTN|nr:class I SAM-dependent methyltransferase [Actinoplanes derwentensis]GID89437.1 putative methyltransferase [Actinoplanes derwentensis]SDS33466.1 Methyltransferase domain-containing protein [Actinoplanes derwentensis]